MATIWTNAHLPPAPLQQLKDGLGSHKLVVAAATKNNLTAGEPDHSLDGADIAFGQPDPKQVIALPKLKWVHLSSAGYTRYDTKEFASAIKARGGHLTNSSSVYNEPCAQHILSMMLSVSRQLPACLIEQMTDRDWAYEHRRYETFLLRGQTAIIYGFGAIGQRLAEMLAPFGMTIIAVRRKPSPVPGIKVIATAQADDELPKADHVIDTLPSSTETDGYFDAKRIARIKSGAHFYNIGRGTTVNQDALKDALDENRLHSAYLDVVTPEPLPPDSPLWKTKHCYITPHIAGGFVGEHGELVEHFLANLKRFEAGEPLQDSRI